MKLRFTGQNGPLGLTTGNNYYLKLDSTSDYICATIFKTTEDTVFSCYSSPQAFAANWSLPEAKHV